MTAPAQAVGGLSYSRYAAIDAVNWTSLKHFRDSPLAYRWHQDHPDTDTTGRARGRLLHALVFEPDTVERTYAVYEGEKNRSSNEYKAFAAQHPGKTILKADEVADVRAQAEAVRRHPAVAPYLVGGSFEVTLRWTDPDTGLACKGRLDWWHKPTRTLIDLKGTTTIHPHYFGRIAARQGYHCQLAHYANGITAIKGERPAKVAILAALSNPPFDVALYTLSDDDLYAGEEELKELLARLAACRAADEWPGQVPAETPIKLPPYIWGDSEDPAELGADFGS